MAFEQKCAATLNPHLFADKTPQADLSSLLWVANVHDKPDQITEAVRDAAKLLAENEVVAFPTETVYGLGGNIWSDDAINKIYLAKGRPSDNPLIIHVASIEQWQEIVTEVNPVAEKLAKAFWPGPLSIILKKKGPISKFVTAGLDTVAVRMPDHPVALALIREAKVPIAAPSANLSGKPSPTAAQHVISDLAGRIAGVVDGGLTGVGLESTVVDCSCFADGAAVSSANPVVILRPGGVTKEDLESVVGAGNVALDAGLWEHHGASGAAVQPRAPGMKYTHYAPRAPLHLVDGSTAYLQSLVDQATAQGQAVGVLTTSERKSSYRADHVIICGSRSDLASVAQHLYDSLRAFDLVPVDVIYSEVFPEDGIGQAVMNRLEKAAGRKLHREQDKKEQVQRPAEAESADSPSPSAVVGDAS